MSAVFEPTRVLCALDFEQPVPGLLDTATSIAKRFDATLYLLHVWLPSVPLAPLDGFVAETAHMEAVASVLHAQLQRAAEAASRTHPRVVTALVTGTPWREIVQYADDQSCDLIVAGTHGRTGVARLVEGSVAERVVRAADVPVLVVPQHVETAVEPKIRATQGAEAEEA